MLRQLDPLRHQGVFLSPSRPDLKALLVATRDIAATAAKDSGLDSTEPRTPENTTPISFRQ
jgi:hypothetical protein